MIRLTPLATAVPLSGSAAALAQVPPEIAASTRSFVGTDDRSLTGPLLEWMAGLFGERG